MINFDCLKEIDYQATNDGYRVNDREHTMSITDDIIDVFDYIQILSEHMSIYHPQFNNGTIAFFSHGGNMYSSFYFQQQGELTIKKGDFLNQEIINEEGFTFEEWASDMMVYYYLDLDTMTVKSLWDNKEYVIKENV